MLIQKASDSSQKVARLADQREKFLQNYSAEEQRRKDLEEDIKDFSLVFARRQKALMSLNCDFRSMIDNLKAQNPIPVSRTPGL